MYYTLNSSWFQPFSKFAIMAGAREDHQKLMENTELIKVGICVDRL